MGTLIAWVGPESASGLGVVNASGGRGTPEVSLH